MSKLEGTHRNVSWFYRFIPPCLLTCITALVYYPSLYYDFQFDDIANIQKHFYIRHHQFKTLFFSGSRWISYWLNAIHYSINKFEPFSFRVGSLIIHSINGILVFFFILTALTHSSGNNFFKRNALLIATITSMLFLLHPVQTQTVSYVIQGQLEGLACMSILAISLTFLHYCYNPCTIKRSVLLILLFALAAIACGTKEITFIAPFLVLLVDWFFVAHGSWRSLKQRLWLHGMLFSLITSIYMYFLKPSFFMNILGFKMAVNNNIGNVITEIPSQTIGPWMFFISQFKVILHYLWIFVWPFNISVEYDWVLARGFFAWDCFLPLLALLTLAIIIGRILTKRPTHGFCFGAIWFFICITPRSSIIPSPELLVDYKTYTASIGWLLIIASFIAFIIEYVSKKNMFKNKLHQHQAHLLLSSLLIVPLGLMTWQRNLVWSSGTAFWMNVITNAPYKARAYNNYGFELSQNLHQYEKAIPYFKKAALMDRFYPDPLNNVAVCYSHLEQIDNAIAALQQGLKISPFYPEGHNNLGSFYLQQKKYDEALQCFKRAIELRPPYGKAYFNMGRAYAFLNEPKLSLEAFKKACTIADLDNAFGYKIYAQAAVNHRELDEALWAFKKSLECDPHDTEVVFGLANCYYLRKDYEQACTIYQQIVTQYPTDWRSWYNLGESYFALAQIDKALNCFKQVEPYWEQLPQVRIRLASCYEKMNNPIGAHTELKNLSLAPQTPAHFKLQAQELLTRLEDHYPQIKTAVMS